MQKFIFTLFVTFALLISNATLSQCSPDESTVQIVILTDAWGAELYWELVPLGQMCGEAPVLLSGGNMGVGCDGDGMGASSGFTYANNGTYRWWNTFLMRAAFNTFNFENRFALIKIVINQRLNIDNIMMVMKR